MPGKMEQGMAETPITVAVSGGYPDGRLRVTIVLEPWAKVKDLRRAEPEIFKLHDDVNARSAHFVKYAKETKNKKSYSQLASEANCKFWRILQVVVSLESCWTSEAAQTHLARCVENAVQFLVDIRGKKAVDDCRQTVKEALDHLREGEGFYDVLDIDHMKAIIKRK